MVENQAAKEKGLKMIELWVQGRCATAGSLKWFGKGKVTHDSSRTKTWEDWIRWTFIQSKYNRMVLLEPPLYANLTFYFNRPKSHFKKSGELTKEGLRYPYPAHRRKNDIDKLTRAVFDSLTSLAYADDGQIVKVTARKLWSEQEGVLIQIDRVL